MSFATRLWPCASPQPRGVSDAQSIRGPIFYLCSQGKLHILSTWGMGHVHPRVPTHYTTVHVCAYTTSHTAVNAVTRCHSRVGSCSCDARPAAAAVARSHIAFGAAAAIYHSTAASTLTFDSSLAAAAVPPRPGAAHAGVRVDGSGKCVPPTHTTHTFASPLTVHCDATCLFSFNVLASHALSASSSRSQVA